ncbi:MAG TPA: hypothetical protein VE863_15580 [Pyrinomonadaceae bacterium]|nr:hypothetical protein [Pyrinomonadaceae bacterium]
MFTLDYPGSFPRIVSSLLLIVLFAGPLAAQQPTPPKPSAQTAASNQAPAFDELLATDTYKLYGEVRNVGQLLGNGGAAEIVDPIVKLADPGPQFKSIIAFLKKNSEALAQARLMFAGWAVRTDVPMVFVAIEFPTTEDATKFAPKLETFLPTVLPPVPVNPEESSAPKETKPGASANQTTAAKPNDVGEKPPARPSPGRNGAPKVEERLPFVITHASNLVCISDKPFKFSKLRPKDSRALFRDQNFRTARDQFSTEPIFLFFNVALEDKSKPSPTPVTIQVEEATQETKTSANETEQKEPTSTATPGASPETGNEFKVSEMQTERGVLGPLPSPSPTPTPTKEEQAQRIASNQIGSMLDAIGYGEPNWPEAIGLAIALEGNEYILRAVMIDKPDAKKTPIPFVPQLIGGPAFTAEAASVLPDDTDILISASIDLTKTYEGMRQAAEAKAKAEAESRVAQSRGANVDKVSDELSMRAADLSNNAFSEFEKKAGLKIKDELLPAFGHEIAFAGSMKALNAMGMSVMGMPSMPTPPESGADKTGQPKKPESVMPVLLIEVKDREAARKLMPKIMNGLGIGEANLIAQVEKNGDTETVNYAGIFAYAFVGDFLVVSDAAGVKNVVDAFVNHSTLSSNTVFRNARRWQSARTTGQIYVSPAMMEAAQADIRKRAPTMDADLRDFLLRLNPNAEAITYALSDDGMGTRHELHLPKDYILMTVASISSATKNPPPETNEGIAVAMMSTLAQIENQYKTGPGNGSYASMKQLTDLKMFPQEVWDKYGYNCEVTVNGDQFEAVATPKEYGKTGKRSFFVDKTGVVRGDDHGGAPATVADKPVQQ